MSIRHRQNNIFSLFYYAMCSRYAMSKPQNTTTTEQVYTFNTFTFTVIAHETMPDYMYASQSIVWVFVCVCIYVCCCMHSKPTRVREGVPCQLQLQSHAPAALLVVVFVLWRDYCAHIHCNERARARIQAASVSSMNRGVMVRNYRRLSPLQTKASRFPLGADRHDRQGTCRAHNDDFVKRCTIANTRVSVHKMRKHLAQGLLAMQSPVSDPLVHGK